MHKVFLLVATFILALLTTIFPTSLLAAPPELILATKWRSGDDPTGWWMSEKFDGVRGYWNGKHMMTRGGNPIVLPDDWSGQLPPFPLDGELWLARGKFSVTLGTVRDQKPGPDWAKITYLIFDAPTVTGPFEIRQETVKQWLAENPSSKIKLIKQQQCKGQSHLDQFLEEVEAKGGEGVMLRAAQSPHENGRSTHLRKVKRFDDSEAQVIGYNPGKGKYTGMVGSLRMELPNGIQFSMGSGLTEELRRTPPPIGKTITFKHHGWTSKGKPRFPVYWRIRNP